MERSYLASFKDLVLGKPKNPLDPKVFHQISLVAFLAWVGLGADGLSSSAYGPEEAYLALGQHYLLEGGLGFGFSSCSGLYADHHHLRGERR